MLKTNTFPQPINLIAWLCVFAVLTLSATRAIALDPTSRPDYSWINISGSVKEVVTNSFKLDYGEGVILVIMNDGDRDADGYRLLPGDKVIVTGMIDNDFFEKASIVASNVYIEKLGTHFFTAVRTLTVDVGTMPYNPLDDEGYQKIRPGNVVRVTGQINKQLFLGRKFIAEDVTKLLR